MKLPTLLRTAAVLALGAAPAALSAQVGAYFVGVAGRTVIPSGTYAGQPNPNAGRLTLLYAHWYADTPASNHYHSKGTWILSGPADAPVAVVSTSNYLPEGSIAPLPLVPGTGIYAGRLVNGAPAAPDPRAPFSNLTLQPTSVLASFAAGTPEAVMFNSSGGRWNGAITGADVHLQLVSLTPGLSVGGIDAIDIGLNAPGDDLHLTDTFAFTPVFHLAADAAPGVYAATFRLVDEEGLLGDSGEFEFRFEAIPEPGTLALAALGLAAALAFRRRR